MPYDATFDDLLQANQHFAASFEYVELKPVAAKGVGVLTCIESRLDPLPMLGLKPGDAKILRNAGARVTDDVLRTLVLARYLLGVTRFMIVAHTNCRIDAGSESQVHNSIREAGGPDTRSIPFLSTPDQVAALADDVQRIRSFPYFDETLKVGGFMYDLRTAKLTRLC